MQKGKSLSRGGKNKREIEVGESLVYYDTFVSKCKYCTCNRIIIYLIRYNIVLMSNTIKNFYKSYYVSRVK